MKKNIIFLLFLFISSVIYSQIPAEDITIKSETWVAQNDPPSNPSNKKKYLDTDGFFYEYNANTSQWVPLITVIDGTETKVTAGTNITISGDGSTGNPYIINSSGGSGTDDQNASEVPFAPNGSISSTDVQAAIQEVRDEASGGTNNLTFSILSDNYIYQASDFATGNDIKTHTGISDISVTIPAGAMPIGAKSIIKTGNTGEVTVTYGVGQNGTEFTVPNDTGAVTIVHYDFGGGDTRILPEGNWVPYVPITNFYTSLDAANPNNETNSVPPSILNSFNCDEAVEATTISNGSYAVELTRTGTSSLNFDMEMGSGFVIGESYTLSADVWIESGGPSGQNIKFRLPSDGGWGVQQEDLTLLENATGAYKNITMTATATATTCRFEVSASTGVPAGFIIRFDNAIVTQN